MLFCFEPLLQPGVAWDRGMRWISDPALPTGESKTGNAALVVPNPLSGKGLKEVFWCTFS